MATEKAKNLGNLLQQVKQGASGEVKAEPDKAEANEVNPPNKAQTKSRKSKKKTTKDAGEFWGQFEEKDVEATDRLNVEIPRKLHEQFKLRCAESGVSKKDAVIQLLKWSLRD